jgi:hypothetical protein
MKEALSSSETRFLQDPHGLTSQKTPFFIVTAVKTSNLSSSLFLIIPSPEIDLMALPLFYTTFKNNGLKGF